MPFTRHSRFSLREIFNQLFNPDTNKPTLDTTMSERLAGDDLLKDRPVVPGLLNARYSGSGVGRGLCRPEYQLGSRQLDNHRHPKRHDI